MEQSSYILTTIILNVVIICGWIWLGVVKYQERRAWHTYACLVYAAAYCVLVWINFGVYEVKSDPLIAANYLKVYFAYLLQVGAVVSFILNSYTKDKK